MAVCGQQCMWSDCGSWCGLEEGHAGVHVCAAHKDHWWSSWFQKPCDSYCPICAQGTGEIVSCMYPWPHMASHKGKCGHTWGLW